MTPNEVPEIQTLETERLILRGLLTTDAEAIYRNFQNYRVIRYLANTIPQPYELSDGHDFILNVVISSQGKVAWVWAICEKEIPDNLIGVIELKDTLDEENHGYWLAEEYWGKGYMSEAQAAVTDFGFEELGLESIRSGVAVENPASSKVLEKNGRRLSKITQGDFIDPTAKESEVWEITREDWIMINSSK